MSLKSRLLVVAIVVLAAGAAWSGRASSAEKRLVRARQLGWERLAGRLAELRLDGPGHALVERRARTDARGFGHVRYQQMYKGLEVFEGEAITHVDANDEVEITSALRGELELDVSPAVDAADAAATAGQEAGLAGRFTADSALKVLPAGERSDSDRLVWHVRVNGRTAENPVAQWDVFVDAKTGEVAWAFDSLQTSAAVGTGKTMYSGTVSLDTDFASSTYYLRDTTRGLSGGNYTCDVNNKQDSFFRRATCTTFTRTSNVFGNGVKDSSDRATAGADAHYGLQLTWGYYKSTFGRNGIDGAGRRTYSRVHYGNSYENAFWSDSCFCMTYGDGKTTFYPLVSIDVAGHEMSHGVMSKEANLTYSGESGGLNESNSDIFGTLVEFSQNGPDAPDWWIGERIYRSNWSGNTFTQTKALRYMDDPGKDGASPACWSSTLKSLDVHYSSGPNNHMFYLLAQDGTTTSKCNGSQVTGIGRARAAAIWYKAIADYMTKSTNYAGARAAALSAAAALYGGNSTEYNAVAAAYSAIGVN
jgi:Zn-dependent metalloprotease